MRSKNQSATIGSQLSPEKRKQFQRFKKANQSRLDAAFRNQRTNTLTKPIKRVVRPKPVENTGPPPLRTFKYWEFPSGVSCRDATTTHFNETNHSELEHLLKLGEESSKKSEGEELHVNIGIDFGTSSTKVIVRLPYEPGEPTFAVPAPIPCRAQDGDHLWRTIIWVKNDGTTYMWPVRNTTALDTLKQDLVLRKTNVHQLDTSLLSIMNHEQVATAYLSFVIRYVRGWLRFNRVQTFKNRKPVWRINIGMPTENFDDLKIAESYRRVAAAALILADMGLLIAADSTQLVLSDSETHEAGQSISAAEELGVAVVPEAAAEMTGFAKSPRIAEGLYMLIDIGAMTLDASIFTLHSNSKQPTIYSFMAAKVRPLGVESYYWFRDAQGKTNDEFAMQCEHTLRSIIDTTKQKKDPHSSRWKSGESVPIFLVGGGARHAIHRSIVDNLHPWMRKYAGNEGIRLLSHVLPKALDTGGFEVDYDRMGVAWGLSYNFAEIGEIHTASDTDDVILKVNPWREKFIGKEMV